MKKLILQFGFFGIFLVSCSITMQAQYGSTKYCPNTPGWNAYKPTVENDKEMFIEYAKGPDGCWWLKLAKFASYKQGYYIFDNNGKKTKYYYNSNKKFWENENRNACVNNPFGG